jgi:spore germination protein GerM
MTRWRIMGFAALGIMLGALVLAAVWVLVPGSRELNHVAGASAAVAAAPAEEAPAPKIKAHLFYVAEDGLQLVSVEHDVPYAPQTSDQAREIVKAQLAPPPPPFVSAIPSGTALRALYLTPQGDAFVDLSAEVATSHPGGTLNELLTIYTVVHALTFNLPAVTSVQLLVDGKETDTLDGHIDLRRPLAKNLQLVAASTP